MKKICVHLWVKCALLFPLWGLVGFCLHAQDTLHYPPGAGTITYICGNITWSGAVRYAGTACAATATLAEADSIPPQYAVYIGSYGYYYNLPCVQEHEAALCPPPWRLLAKPDFYSASRCFGLGVIAARWGNEGIMLGNRLHHEFTRGATWLTTRDRRTYLYAIWRSDAMGFTEAWAGAGVQVRCVKN